MAPAQYAPLPNPRSAPDDADRELDEAFGSEYDETDETTHTESTPFISTTERRQPLTVATPGLMTSRGITITPSLPPDHHLVHLPLPDLTTGETLMENYL